MLFLGRVNDIETKLIIRMSYKVLIATYTVEESFVIPKNIDLENEEKVESYWVKYNTLHIKLTNGKHIEIDNQGWVNNYDYKYPSNDETRIEEGCDYGLDDEDEEFNEVDIGIFEKEEIKKLEDEEDN
jgi:hypothetical protein